jgi:hypothetical protein
MLPSSFSRMKSALERTIRARKAGVALVVVALVVLGGTVWGATAIGSATDGRGAFTDDDGSIHEPDINGLAASEITKGCNPPANTQYCPQSPVTRAQMASFLVRALGLPPATDNPFTDTTGSVHQADIAALAQADITRGCNPPANNDDGPPPNPQYCPNSPVTRAQMASFLVRALDGVDAILNRLSLRTGVTCTKDGTSCSRRATLASGIRLEISEGWYQVLPYQTGEEAAFKAGDTNVSVTWDGSPVEGVSLGIDESRSPATRIWRYRLPPLTSGSHTLRATWRWSGDTYQTATVVISVP